MGLKLCLFLFSFLPNLIFAQNYLDYYQGINKARMLATSENAKESAKLYYNTFEKYEFVFARDCYNAIEISAFAEDTSKLEYFIKRGIKQGLELNYILSHKYVSEFQNSAFIKGIELIKDSLESVYSNSINWEIRNEITEMFTQDQAIRERYYNSILFKRLKIGKEWEALNKAQVERMIEITKEYGFVGENLIGIDTKKMHPKIENSNLSAGMPIVIFIHHYSQPNISYDSIWFEQIAKGNLYNEHFATICDFEIKFGKNKYENFGFFAFKQRIKNVNLMEIEKRRKKIALLTIEEFKKMNQNTVITRLWNRLY